MKTVRRESVQVHEGTDNTGRIALLGLLLVLSLLVAAVQLVAQTAPTSRGAIRPFVGAYIPTGDQRDFLKDAVLARDYVSRFQPLIGGGSTKTRNDVALFAGVGVRF